MIFCEDICAISKEYKEWCEKDEEEQSKIAEENAWEWYFDWFDTGDRLRYKYEQIDKDPKVANKYGGYDRWYETHKTESSYVYLGADACFHESNKPIRQWTVYNDCTNFNCKYNKGKDTKGHHRCSYFYDNSRMYDCFNDLFASLQSIKDITGDLSIVKKHFNIHKDIIGWFEQGNRYFKQKGDDNMAKPFWTALAEIQGEPKVFWTDGTMYVNGENDTQASTSGISLFQAYRFVSLLESYEFDYEATDEEVKELQKELLEFYKDIFSEDEQQKYIIDVWEYLDDIADDYKKLTGVNINDIDYKRAIVSYMSETDWENNCAMGFGSGTYIARLVSDHIIGNKRNNVEKCNNLLATQLAEKYLQTDDYDLWKFAEELHKECEYKMDIPSNFDKYLIQSSRISYKCYELLGYLIANDINYKQQFLVGYIDWFGDYKENERYIYCHIDSSKNEIYFQENRQAPKSAYLHDIAFPHLVFDTNRLQQDIEIKFTEQYIDDIMNDFELTDNNRDAYIHCHMYGTIGKYTG